MKIPDREKVIKGLECVIGTRGVKNCDDCPYDNDFNCLGCDIVVRDALELLKEQEPVAVSEKWDVGHYYACGACDLALGILHGEPKFCPDCGRKINWNLKGE